jgi:short-subunit dehydrogenase
MTQASIVITGASDGIGKALAWEMAQRGYSLGLTARRLNKLEEIKADILKTYPNCRIEVAALDVSHYEDIGPCLDNLNSKLGSIDIVLANAGIAKSGKVGKTPWQQHVEVINTNVNGAIVTLSEALRIFRAQGHGHLVGTSSVAAFRGLPNNATYSASKAALATFMEGIRAETINEKINEKINVTVLYPGFIDTSLNRDLKSRPFVISVEQGAKLFADLIEAKVHSSTVPKWPWSLLGNFIKVLPTSLIAKM